MKEENEKPFDLNNVVGAMMSTVIGAMMYPIVRKAIEEVLGSYIRKSKLWITSPSGETTVKLPFYTALRIVRNKNWSLTKVEPIRYLSRWEYLKLAVRGNKEVKQ